MGGEPIIPGRQEQSQRSPRLLGKFVFGPHGFGIQGSSATTGSMTKKNNHGKRIYVVERGNGIISFIFS